MRESVYESRLRGLSYEIARPASRVSDFPRILFVASQRENPTRGVGVETAPVSESASLARASARKPDLCLVENLDCRRALELAIFAAA